MTETQVKLPYLKYKCEQCVIKRHWGKTIALKILLYMLCVTYSFLKINKDLSAYLFTRNLLWARYFVIKISKTEQKHNWESFCEKKLKFVEQRGPNESFFKMQHWV